MIMTELVKFLSSLILNKSAGCQKPCGAQDEVILDAEAETVHAVTSVIQSRTV